MSLGGMDLETRSTNLPLSQKTAFQRVRCCRSLQKRAPPQHHAPPRAESTPYLDIFEDHFLKLHADAFPSPLYRVAVGPRLHLHIERRAGLGPGQNATPDEPAGRVARERLAPPKGRLSAGEETEGGGRSVGIKQTSRRTYVHTYVLYTRVGKLTELAIVDLKIYVCTSNAHIDFSVFLLEGGHRCAKLAKRRTAGPEQHAASIFTGSPNIHTIHTHNGVARMGRKSVVV